jgi:predicted acetyltransferase
MINLVSVTKEQEQTLHNIMQFYIYEFSSYIPAIKLEENGAYSPFNLEDYWTTEDHYAFLIKDDTELVGFALLKTGLHEEHHYINEFFIMKKFSGKGYGAAAAKSLFDRFPGKWKITQIHNNYPAQAFWRKVVNDYTNGFYKEYYDEKRRSVQEFTTPNKEGV